MATHTYEFTLIYTFTVASTTAFLAGATEYCGFLFFSVTHTTL